MKSVKLKICALVLACLVAVTAVAAAVINIHICSFAKERILTEEEASALTDVDCILVLGCGVREDGTPSATACKEGFRCLKTTLPPSC